MILTPGTVLRRSKRGEGIPHRWTGMKKIFVKGAHVKCPLTYRYVFKREDGEGILVVDTMW